jgi:hypothetical protein
VALPGLALRTSRRAMMMAPGARVSRRLQRTTWRPLPMLPRQPARREREPRARAGENTRCLSSCSSWKLFSNTKSLVLWTRTRKKKQVWGRPGLPALHAALAYMRLFQSRLQARRWSADALRDGAKDGQEDVDLPVDDEAGTAGENASQTLEQARAHQRRRMDDPPPMPRVLKIADWKCNRADGTDSWLEVVTHCPKARPGNIGACEVRWPSMHAYRGMSVHAQAVEGLADGTMC